MANVLYFQLIFPNSSRREGALARSYFHPMIQRVSIFCLAALLTLGFAAVSFAAPKKPVVPSFYTAPEYYKEAEAQASNRKWESAVLLIRKALAQFPEEKPKAAPILTNYENNWRKSLLEDAKRLHLEGKYTESSARIATLRSNFPNSSEAAAAEQTLAANRSKAHLEGYKLQLVSYCGDRDETGYLRVEGKVKNITSEPLARVQVSVKFFDKYGNFILADATTVDQDPIQPGQISPFSNKVRHNPNMASFRVYFTEIFGDEIPTYSRVRASRDCPN
jgi:hypothetical protein